MLEYRLATQDDRPALVVLMSRAIDELQRPFLTPELIAASRAVMGLDTALIEDGTYYAIEDGGVLAGCGGWSRRATLYGGDHSAGRSAALLDPDRDAARIRAMYTHPDHTRRGVGRLILSVCEAAASAEGFRRCQLAATLAGEPLYRACGYQQVERFEDNGVPLVRMEKTLAS